MEMKTKFNKLVEYAKENKEELFTYGLAAVVVLIISDYAFVKANVIKTKKVSRKTVDGLMADVYDLSGQLNVLREQGKENSDEFNDLACGLSAVLGGLKGIIETNKLMSGE